MHTTNLAITPIQLAWVTVHGTAIASPRGMMLAGCGVPPIHPPMICILGQRVSGATWCGVIAESGRRSGFLHAESSKGSEVAKGDGHACERGWR